MPIQRRQKPRTRTRTGTGNLFQFHLSTALVMMIVTGALVGANVPHDALGQKSGLIYVRQGWPYCFFADWHREDPEKQEAIIGAWFEKHPYEPAATLIKDVKGQEVEHALRIDIMIGLFILTASLIVAEILARSVTSKRRKRNEDVPDKKIERAE